MIDKIANEAARIKRNNPDLKFYQAVIQAKEIIKKEKGPQERQLQKSQ